MIRILLMKQKICSADEGQGLVDTPSKKFKDIRTSSGKDSLRKEILAQLNPLLNKCKITNLYFQEFVIQ